MKIEQCEFPDDLLYDPEGLVWARPLESGEIVVGITSIHAALAGPVLKVSAKPLTASYNQHAAIGFLESGKYFGPIRSPVGGVLREVNGAAPVGSEQRLVVVASGGADKFPGVFGKILYDRLRVFLLERLSCDDDRSGIHVLGVKACFLVGLLYELFDLIRIDQGSRKVRGKHDFRTVENFPLCHLKAPGKRRAFSSQRQLRKNEVRRRRPDVDAHAFQREHLKPFDIF